MPGEPAASTAPTPVVPPPAVGAANVTLSAEHLALLKAIVQALAGQGQVQLNVYKCFHGMSADERQRLHQSYRTVMRRWLTRALWLDAAGCVRCCTTCSPTTFRCCLLSGRRTKNNTFKTMHDKLASIHCLRHRFFIFSSILTVQLLPPINKRTRFKKYTV